MTYRRQPGSIEARVLECLQQLSPEDVALHTGKQPSALYKAANPLDRQQLQFLDAVGLEVAMVGIHGEPVFQPLFADLTRIRLQFVADRAPAADPMDRLAQVVKEVGDLADELRAARDARGAGGRRIVSLELERVIAEAVEAQDAIGKLIHELNGQRADQDKAG